MKKVLFFSAAFLLFSFLPRAGAQSEQPAERKVVPDVTTLAGTITGEDLYRHLATLASDEFQGRETGTTGQQKAAEYIAGYFRELGLPAIGEDNSYFQTILFKKERWESIGLSIAGSTSAGHLRDFYAYPAANPGKVSLNFDEVTFLGYGIDDPAYSDYGKRRVEGKAVLIYAGEPVNAEGRSLVTGTTEVSDWTTNWQRKVRVAQEKGAAAVFFIDGQFRENLGQARRLILNNSLQMESKGTNARPTIPNLFLSSTLARELMGDRYDKVIAARDRIQTKGRSRQVKLKSAGQLTMEKEDLSLRGANVLGYIEGIDPALRDEVVVLTAHYDHLGMRGDDIYYGADDNASGTSTLLEVCQAFAAAREEGAGPRRSVLVMLVSGEEKGLLGSEYYVSNPVFPLAQTVVDINVDMVGRVDDKHQDNPNYVYVIGADRLSTELHAINESANATYTGLELDYTYNAESDPNRYYYRSDHYNFARKGIPAIFFFNGTHADYHRTTDTLDKINFEKMEKIGRLVFYTAWELANRAERIKVDVPAEQN